MDRERSGLPDHAGGHLPQAGPGIDRLPWPPPTDDPLEQRSLRLRLGALSWLALSEEAVFRGMERGDLVAEACGQPLGSFGAGVVLQAPRLGEAPSPPTGRMRAVTLGLPASRWAILEAEAIERDVTLESLVLHATLVYLARPG